MAIPYSYLDGRWRVKRKIKKPSQVKKQSQEPGLLPRSDAMTATATAIDNFEKTVKQHTTKKLGDAAEVLAQIEKVKNTNPMIYEEGKIKTFLSQRSKALNVLINNFIVAKLSAQYPLLDKSIFNLKRHLYIRDDVVVEDSTEKIEGGDALQHFELPLFVHTLINQDKVEVAKLRTRTNRDRWGGSVQKTVSVTASVPAMPINVHELGLKALGFYHMIVAEIYSKSTTSNLYAPVQPTLETMWIPTAKSLSVKVDIKNIPAPRRFDPALVMNCGDHYYLISLWDIDEELPFENILREFTVGAVKFPKKEKES